MIEKLILTNGNNESVDMINEFKVDKNEISFEWINNNELIAQQMRIASGRSNLLPERSLSTFTTSLSMSEWEDMRSLFTKDQERLMLMFNNGVNDYIVYVDDVPNLKYTPISYTDFVDIQVTFNQLSHLFLIKNFKKKYRDSNDDINYGKYPIKYGEFKYAPSYDTTFNNYLNIDVEGDTSSPYILIIPKGGINPLIEVTSANGETNSIRLLGDYTNQMLVINSYEMLVTADGFDVSDRLDSDYQNWFYFDNGLISINVQNCRDYIVQVMNVRRTP